MKLPRIPDGYRTFLFAAIGLAVLLAGFRWALTGANGPAIFLPFAGAVVGVVTMVATKHGVESLATGGGIAGAWKALTTATKPEPPVQP